MVLTKPTYLDTLPIPLAVQVAEYEVELDAIHPGWRSDEREKRRFDHLDEPVLKRVKYLLKRRDLLRQGRDWPVTLHPGSVPGQWFAHPIMPNPGKDDAAQPTAIAPEQVSVSALVEALKDPAKREQLALLGLVTK